MIDRSPLIDFCVGVLLGFAVIQYAPAITPWLLPDPPLPPPVTPTLALPPPISCVSAEMTDQAPQLLPKEGSQNE